MRTHARIVHPPDWPHAAAARELLVGNIAERWRAAKSMRLHMQWCTQGDHTWRVYHPAAYVTTTADLGASPGAVAGLGSDAPEELELCPWGQLSTEHLFGHVEHLCEMLRRRGKGAHQRDTRAKRSSALRAAIISRSASFAVEDELQTACLDQKIEQLSFALAEMKYRNLIPSAAEMRGPAVSVFWDRELSLGRTPSTLLELALEAARGRARR